MAPPRTVKHSTIALSFISNLAAERKAEGKQYALKCGWGSPCETAWPHLHASQLAPSVLLLDTLVLKSESYKMQPPVCEGVWVWGLSWGSEERVFLW